MENDLILITGGAGYVGSHICVELARSGHDFVIMDNLSNSTPSAVDRLAQLVERPVRLYEADIRDEAALQRIFLAHPISSVIHCAGLKVVGDSLSNPIDYFSNNVAGSISLLGVMRRANCKRLVFSSSANVYGDAASMPVTEATPCLATNPYGRTKLAVEEILRDVHKSDPAWSIATLRYFNPVGAHESGLIGESTNGTPTNLMPHVAQVAAGIQSKLRVFGGDYPTPDGTGVRDFIHVSDLATAHVAALDYLAKTQCGIVVNIGTGRGTSVLEVIRAFERASGRTIKFEISSRRFGDVAVSFADVTRAKKLFGWRASRSMDQICSDAWRWQMAGH